MSAYGKENQERDENLKNGIDMAVMTDEERKIAREVQGDIPLEKRPFESIAQRIGMKEDDVVSILKRLQEKGVMRRFGAVLRHVQAGFSENAMVVWAVPEERCEEIGFHLASYTEISHCYERTPPFEGVYTLFTMVHLAGDSGEAGEPDRMDTFVRSISQAIGIEEYRILRTLRELKKSSMEYF